MGPAASRNRRTYWELPGAIETCWDQKRIFLSAFRVFREANELASLVLFWSFAVSLPAYVPLILVNQPDEWDQRPTRLLFLEPLSSLSLTPTQKRS